MENELKFYFITKFRFIRRFPRNSCQYLKCTYFLMIRSNRMTDINNSEISSIIQLGSTEQKQQQHVQIIPQG